MGLYHFLSYLFPRSYLAKVFALAFIGTHVPLIAMVSYIFTAEGNLHEHFGTIGLLLAATLIGTAWTLISLRMILSPIYKVERAMSCFETARQIRGLPDGYTDAIGRLMTRTNRLVLNVEERLDDATRAAETDPLTGVLNRRGFKRRQELEGHGAVLLLDLDHFKRINDRHGHDIGDQVLQQVAKVARTELRDADLLARFGGEEFVIFLPRTSAEMGREIAERVRKAIEAQVIVAASPITTSIGLALAPSEQAFEAALKSADTAVYAAKAQGRNMVCLAA